MNLSLEKKYEVSLEKLRSYKCNPQEFQFKTIKELEQGLETIILGEKNIQKVNSLKKGLKMPYKQHNIFVTGPEDEEREEIIMSQIRDYLRSMPKEDYTKKVLERKDLVSAYNFEDSNHPIILELPTGTGELFQKDVNGLTDKLLKDGMKIYEKQLKKRKENNDKKLQEIAIDVQKKAGKLAVEADSLELEMRKLKFENTKLQQNDPEIKENEKRIQELDKEIKRLDQGILQMQADYKNTATDMTREAINEEKLDAEKDKEYYLKNVVKHSVEELKKKYGSNTKILKYFDEFEKRITVDVKAELDSVSNKHSSQEGQTGMISLGGLSGIAFGTPSQAQPVKDTSEYKVKLLNKLTPEETVLGIPVIFEKKPELENLFGTIPLQEQYVVSPLGTEAPKKNQHLKLKPGSFIKALGGYLVIETMSSLGSLVKLIETLDSKEVSIENILYNKIVDKSSESIDCSNIKIILSGQNDIYQLLESYSKHGVLKFNRIFGYKVELDPFAENTKQTREQYTRRIAKLCKDEGLKNITPEGLAKVIDYAAELAGNQDKLVALNLLPIKNLLREANIEAEGSKEITEEHIKKAIEEKKGRHDLIEREYQEIIEKGKIMIDTQKEIPERINGLAVYSNADAKFGVPQRISAISCLGSGTMIRVDRDAELEGEIKKKADRVMEGNFKNLFGKDKYIPIDVSLSFEQSYGKIDGDSATLAELLVTLSSLSGCPIKQGIAVTGSLNQHGEVQPIGGVNEKIEGFYDICKKKEPSGGQGVMIPALNVDELMLKDEILEYVQKDKFHIYAVKTLDEAIEVMFGMNAGYKEDRKFEEGTLYHKVNEKIKELNEIAKSFKNK